MFRPAPGAVVGGRYRLQGVIGWGSMGEVWRAQDLELERPCAVKFILGHLATDEGVRARLLQEAKAAALLRSAHAVQVLGVGEHEGAMFLAMELLEGETLSTRLGRGQLLSPVETVTLLTQVTHALEKAHAAGIVHRDLKPDNIWLCADHELFVKVLDFGVAKTQLSEASKHTATGALLGTPHYMSPEQAMAEREVDHRADLWSLAIIAVECLTGKRPFEANGVAALLLQLVSQPPPPLAQLAPQLPETLAGWWQRALQRDPEQRFQSSSELVEALKRGLEAGDTASLPARKLEPLRSSLTAAAVPTVAVATAAAQTASGTFGQSKTAWRNLPSVSSFSRTHVARGTSRRWRRAVLVGVATGAALAAGVWLLLRHQGATSANVNAAVTGGLAVTPTQPGSGDAAAPSGTVSPPRPTTPAAKAAEAPAPHTAQPRAIPAAPKAAPADGAAAPNAPITAEAPGNERDLGF